MPSTEDILNAITANASVSYQERVPQATQDNITAVGNAILSYTPAMNEFLDTLIQRIGLVVIRDKMAKNKLAIFKKGTMTHGFDIEEIFVEIAKAKTYDITNTNPFTITAPEVKAMFHRLNRQDKYPVSIYDSQLRQAFTSSEGVSRLITSIVNQLYSAAALDEFILMKQLIVDYYTAGNFKGEVVSPVTDQATAKLLVEKVRRISAGMEFTTDIYNKAGVLTTTETSNQILIMRSDISATLDTQLLAWAFHQNLTDFNTRVITVDNFGDNEDIQAVLVDRDFFLVYDNLFHTESIRNPEGLYTNYFLHVWQVLSTSQFSNAVVFTTDDTYGVEPEPDPEP